MIRRTKRNPKKPRRMRMVRRRGMRAPGSDSFLNLPDTEFNRYESYVEKTSQMTRWFESMTTSDGSSILKPLIDQMKTTPNTHGRVIEENNRRQTVLEHTFNMLTGYLGSGTGLRTDWMQSQLAEQEFVRFRRILRMAGFFHDSGKILTRSHKHDEYSATLLADYGQQLINAGYFTRRDVDIVGFILGNKEKFFDRNVSADDIRQVSELLPEFDSTFVLRVLLMTWVADSSTLPAQVWFTYRRSLSILLADKINNVEFENLDLILEIVNLHFNERSRYLILYDQLLSIYTL
jgi:hypothetical protein